MSTVESTPAKSDVKEEIVGEFPCTQTQLRCWIINQLSPGNPALNVAVRWEIRGIFKASTIEAAFRKVIQRHEVLRTRFIERDGQPFQQAVEKTDFKMVVIDLRNMPSEQREKRISSIGDETARVPFDLSRPGLFHVTLLMAENDRGFLLITAHQSCFDGWSIRVLGREVGEIAAAIDAGRTPALPELELQYGDYALWQEEYLGSYGFETEKAFWRERLTGAPYFEVPPDRPRGAVKTSHGDIISILLPLSFGDRMDAAARKYRVSLYSYGAAIMSAMLHRLTNAPTVLFGSQVAGREDTDLENLIGVFINNLVFRYDFTNDVSFAEHIRSANETLEAVLNHQRMPFNKLVELVNPVRDPSRNPLISVNFNLQKAFLEDHRYGDFELISAPSQSPGVLYDLSFMMVGRPSGWRMNIEYNTDLFDKSTIEALLKLWQDTYEIALSNPDALLSSLVVPDFRPVIPKPRDEHAAQLERILRTHPSVGDVAVVTEARPARRVAAFATPAPTWSEPIDRLPAVLMQYLATQLPPDAMPNDISILLSLPRTRSGTIDHTSLHLREPLPTAPAVPQPMPAESRVRKPDTDKMETLASLWSKILGVQSVRPEDDFFALGGHSLLALRLLSSIRERFDVKPTLELLFKEPTLEKFAAAIFETSEGPTIAEATPNPWELITCKRGSGRSAVYTFNHPFLFYRLANELPDAVSVHNINMFNAKLNSELAQMSLEQIAKLAIDAMQIPPDTGPVAIVGLCVNGILAMEITRQLREAGVEVGFTVVIDAWAPGYFRSQPKLRQKRWNAERRIKRMIYFTRKLFYGRMPVIEYLKEFNVTLALLQKLGVSGGQYSPEEQANAEVTELLVRASRSYRPVPSKDPSVILLRSQANHPRARKLLFGWGDAVAKDTAVLDLKGWHEDSLSNDGIRELAAIVSRKLDG
ncbi:condensation domain-containing protein [Rhizobium mongolense]|uniref:AMP-binding enzyme n=1 Tax=Rhizobium mongolense USDA 1844 TaxID=1079460 RepID=A0A559SX56_9HYPH|nr:condensation domain-containing protein [Rhizobium mongolense]TVZ66937.1 AMP-binding enzyme [Rhizobium mongolense USDA 1844]